MKSHQSHKLDKIVLVALRQDWLVAKGKSDAFNFACKINYTTSQLKTKIQQTESLLASISDEQESFHPENEKSHFYQTGYLDGLREVLGIVDKTISGQALNQFVPLRAFSYSGREDAFALALEGDITKIESEIQRVKESLARANSKNSALPGPNTSPYVYNEAYLAGLNDALNIILAKDNDVKAIK